jgi:hypothetical protein
VRTLADRLGELGEQRWRLATNTPVLVELRDLAQSVSEPLDRLTLSAVASLAAFRGLPLVDPDSGVDVDSLLAAWFHSLYVDPADTDRSPLARSVIASVVRTGDDVRSPRAFEAVLLYVLSPDPLTLLIRRALGLPDDESER